jgi:hypothetical protein
MYPMLAAFVCVTLAGCNSTRVRTTEHEKVVRENVPIQEDQLLDVGVGIFNPGVVADEDNDAEGVYLKIREAEARFMPFIMMETLQQSGNWGMVRVIPERQSEMDVWVDAEILKSDGASLELAVEVQDSSGRIWFSKKYRGEASKYSYDRNVARHTEPFQGVYNQIANDMLRYHHQLSPGEISSIRTITGLRFAQRFSPDIFSGHLITNKAGQLEISRIPAENDPVLTRIKQIRERDYMFVDTLQEYYASFVRQMDIPYLEWRKAFYEESENLRAVRTQANQRLIGGAIAVLAGILAQGSDSRVARTAGQVGIGAGAAAVYSGINKREEAKFHLESLEQISDSLEGEMEPHTIALQDKSVTLTGTVNEQYSQWRSILKEIYAAETGQPVN